MPTKDEKNIIKPWNLVCLEGHVSWSPTPEKYVGESCNTKVREGTHTTTCREELVPYAE